MILFTTLIIFLIIFEVKSMLRNKLKRELKVFILLALITFASGYYYISNPYGKSIANIIFTFFGIKY